MYGVLPNQFPVHWWRAENCGHNFYRAIRERMIDRTHEFDARVWHYCNDTARLLCALIPGHVDTITPYEVVRRAGAYTVKGQKMLRGAEQHWVRDDRGLRFKLCGMSKWNENYPFCFDPLDNGHYTTAMTTINDFVEAKIDKIPRPIQFPLAPEWFIGMAVRLVPLEHYICEASITFPNAGPKSRVILKGLSPFKRAELFWDKMSRFENPVIIKLDGAKWDRQYNIMLLLSCLLVYISLLDPHQGRILRDLFFKSIHPKGEAQFGEWRIIWQLIDQVLSGKIDTGLGNSLAFVLILLAFFMFPPFRRFKWDMGVDGDDCMLIIEATALSVIIKYIPRWFYLFGHNVTVEGIHFSYKTMVFCQSKLVRLNIDGKPTWSFVRDPRVVVSRASTHDDYAGTKKKAATHLYTVALGELVLNRGAPFLQDWCVQIMRHALEHGAKPFAIIDTTSSLYFRLVDYLREIGEIPPTQPIFTRKGYVDVPGIDAKLLSKYAPAPVLSVTLSDYFDAFGVSPEEWSSLSEQMVLPFNYPRIEGPCSCPARHGSCFGSKNNNLNYVI